MSFLKNCLKKCQSFPKLIIFRNLTISYFQFPQPREALSHPPVLESSGNRHYLWETTAGTAHLRHAAQTDGCGSVSHLQRQSGAHRGGHSRAAHSLGAGEEVLEPEKPGAREKAALLPLRIRKNHRTQVLRGVLLLLLIRRMMKLVDL